MSTLRLILRTWWRHRRTGSATRRLLERHLAVALLLGVLGTASMLLSYERADQSSAQLRTASVSAVRQLAAIRLSLLRAHEEVRYTKEKGLSGVVGTGEPHRTAFSSADQTLTELRSVQVDGERGRALLSIVNGLMTVYRESVTDAAVRYEGASPMWEQKFGEASSVLWRARVGLIPRLDALQRDQLDRIRTGTELGPLQIAGWTVAEVALTGLALTILSALRVLRRRCGRRYDGWLVAALLLAVALAVLPLWATAVTQNRVDGSRAELARHVTRAGDDTRPVAVRQQEQAQPAPDMDLASGHWRPEVFPAFVMGGILVCVLPVVGCARRLNADYWRASS
ncbi:MULTISPECIES: hypothetical protein [Streptomyces]|uniref:Integral membrane protein n=1 Tax=Streptomyces cremeus TaxID=66881 RepID=A0ABV5PDG5_STRCM